MALTVADHALDRRFGLDERAILVTGAAGRIGGEIVSACLAAGARVVAVDLDEEAIRARAAEAAWPLDRVLPVAADVTDRAAVTAAVARGVAAFGGLDGLVNNAGIGVFESFFERTEEDFDRVTDVNMKGPFWCMQAFLAHRRDAGGGGAMVNIASHYGQISPDPRIYYEGWQRNSAEVYGGTKAALIQMTRYFAVHAAPFGVRSNAVAPGGVRNRWKEQPAEFLRRYGERCPMGRMAEVEEIAAPVVFLLSAAASYVNGQTLTVDGGMTAW